VDDAPYSRAWALLRAGGVAVSLGNRWVGNRAGEAITISLPLALRSCNG